MCAVFLCVVSVVSVCLALACVVCQCGFVMRRERATLCAVIFVSLVSFRVVCQCAVIMGCQCSILCAWYLQVESQVDRWPYK